MFHNVQKFHHRLAHTRPLTYFFVSCELQKLFKKRLSIWFPASVVCGGLSINHGGQELPPAEEDGGDKAGKGGWKSFLIKIHKLC